MTKLFMALLVLSFGLNSFANTCELKINDESWAVKLDKGQNKRLQKILAKKGYILDKKAENPIELKLDISYVRGELRGEIADSKSTATLVKDGSIIASSDKEYCALINTPYIDLTEGFEQGVRDIIVFGATKEGAHRRLIKAVKALPDCNELAEFRPVH